MKFTAINFKHFLINVGDLMEQNKDYLSDLDIMLGDGDHGITMSIGWKAIRKKVSEELLEEEDCGKISAITGRSFLNAVGSSVGPLYATGFIKGAKVVQGKTAFTEIDLVNFWTAFIDGIKERGQAEVGDKTMIDTFEPAKNSMVKTFEESQDILTAFTNAVEDAKKGMESTKEMPSKKGRSSRLGERSIGHQDPGATSAFIVLSAFLEEVKAIANTSK
ncbi:dihydroxyacetone kinase subunit DhaL [Virgibacillus dakarensis]|uniref:dihydroxyacetone kinase subunit DhaL n=1 Tax=Virgibacillus dakarensis TaxID=1917889 RepID=UPI000B451687|nr:dihydroxyacetone kinase subunit DhaL [Virgibacillus dakarensis]